MDKDLMVTWLEAGMSQIPYMLIVKYRDLGLNEQDLAILIHIIAFREKGNQFPTPEQLASRMTMNSDDCTKILRKLVQMGLMNIEENISDRGLRYEEYSLTPLWNRLIDEIKQERKQNDVSQVLVAEQDLYTLFESEFGRPLSPIECEQLAMWVDQDGQDPTIIKAALKEAVISSKLSFRYIDRILFEWKKNGIKTIDQARTFSEKFRQKNVQSTGQKSTISANDSPFYNWLDSK